ncbi:MAG: hypothetical protein HFJ45_10580, partial [Clostridia bacterium]|nr:hypothetical protein [Clostridia bacterium]
MISQKIKMGIVGILILLISIFLIQLPSLAGSFSVTSSKTTMTVGETAICTVTANRCGGKFNITSSDSSVISIEGTLPWTENESNSVTLRANKAGTATITLEATSVADADTAEDIEGSKSITIKVNDPAPVNDGKDTSGANLKSITVAGKIYNNPATDFTVTVGSDVNAVEVKAIANDGNAKISGTGAKDLVTGTNVVTITVTAS